MLALQTLLIMLRNVFVGEVLRRRVTDELDALSDRELADMGVSRSDILRLAREAVAAGEIAAAGQSVCRPASLPGSVQPV